MVTAMPQAEETRLAIIEAAEQLFARHGVDGVSMRDVAAAAGQLNNSAVQYHFGGRDNLLLAVFRYRMGDINQARRAHLTAIDQQGRGGEPRALFEAIILPIAEFIRTQGEDSHYARFLARVAPSVDFASESFDGVSDAANEVVARLTTALPHLPGRAAIERLDIAFTMCISALAVHEQRRALDLNVVPITFEATVEHLIDMAVGALAAPISNGATSRRERTGITSPVV